MTTEVKLFIDLTSTVQREALNNLFDAIASGSESPKKEEVAPKKEEVAPKKEEVAPKPKKKAPKVEEPAAEEEAPEEEIKISDVRSELATKVNLDGNRPKIKAKLTELGAANVTVLDEAKYEEFLTFLQEL